MEAINLTNKRYGKLTALYKVPVYTKRKTASWMCICDCGSPHIADTQHLRKGTITNCGCYKHNKKDYGESNFQRVLRSYKKNAKLRSLEFTLEESQFRQLVTSNCHYCGIEPRQIMLEKKSNGKYLYNGIDRIDNSIGYIPGNVVTCCKTCNIAKRTMSYYEFRSWIKQVYAFWICE